MKTTKSTGTNYVPAHRTATDGKLPSFITYFLPEDCKVLGRSDYYYATAIAAVCATFIFPPFAVVAIYCVVKAKKGGQS